MPNASRHLPEVDVIKAFLTLPLLLGAAGAWQQVVEDGGHAETATMREAVLRWLDGFIVAVAREGNSR